MAKRKAKKRTTTKRRGRVSGIGAGGMLQTVGGVVAGAVAANFLHNFIGSKVSNPMIVAAATVGGGLMLPKLIKGGMGVAMSHGAVATGGVKLLAALKVPGIGNISDAGDMYSVGMLVDIDDDGMSGIDDGLAGMDDGLGDVSESYL